MVYPGLQLNSHKEMEHFMNRSRTTTMVAMSGVLASVVALSGCGTEDSGHEHQHTPGAEPIALTYDGGIYVLDGASLTQRADVKIDGYNRLNPVGDDDHLMVSTKEGFRASMPTTARSPGPSSPPPNRATLFATRARRRCSPTVR